MAVKKIENVEIPKNYKLTREQAESLERLEDVELGDFSDSPYVVSGLRKTDGVWRQVY